MIPNTTRFRVTKVRGERDPWMVGRYEDGRFCGGIGYPTFPEAIDAACEWACNLARIRGRR